MKIVWDLDGVLRDLNGYLMRLYGGEYPTKWNFSYNGKSIYECIDESLNILIDAPPTAYLKVVKQHYDAPEIWTSQKKHWKEYTLKWIHHHISPHSNVRFLKCEEKETCLVEASDLILVEDSPNFSSYDQILLIDRPYNQEVKGVTRIFGPKHLNNMIELLKEL